VAPGDRVRPWGGGGVGARCRPATGHARPLRCEAGLTGLGWMLKSCSQIVAVSLLSGSLRAAPSPPLCWLTFLRSKSKMKWLVLRRNLTSFMIVVL
jgi:hypothetical protein